MNQQFHPLDQRTVRLDYILKLAELPQRAADWELSLLLGDEDWPEPETVLAEPEPHIVH